MVLKTEHAMVGIIIALLVGTGSGYIYGQSPIAGYKEEIERLETENLGIRDSYDTLHSDHVKLTSEYSNLTAEKGTLAKILSLLERKYESLQNSHSSLQSSFDDLKTEYGEYQVSYKVMWDKFDALIHDYNNLTSVTPVGEMVVTEIPGIVNGDFEPREGWLIHGKTGGGPSLPMHQYSSTTYATQTIQINDEDEGISFSIKPQPLGGTVSFSVRVTDVEGYSDTIIYYEEFSGLNSDFDWIKIMVPFKPLFDMKSNYGLEASGAYNLRFSVPAGPDIGSIIYLDEVSLVEISYQPEEPEPSQ